MQNHRLCSTTLYPTPVGTKFQGRAYLEDCVPVLVTVLISSDQRRARLRLAPALLVKTSVFKAYLPQIRSARLCVGLRTIRESILAGTSRS
jgi:hypothetical protein